MIRSRFIGFFTWTVLLSAVQLNAQIGNGLATARFGTANTYSASVMNRGFLSAYNGGRVFAVAGVSGLSSTSVNVFDASNSFTIAYGFFDNFDILASIQTYQDFNINSVNVQQKRQAATPGDIFVMLRNGSYEIMEGKLALGGGLTVRIPTGKQNNIPFEVYNSRKVEFGFLGMATLYGNPYYKDQSYLVNFNLGFWSHNDNGSRINPDDATGPANSFSPTITATSNSMHLQYGLGFSIPIRKVELMVDAYGISFLTAPEKHVYSRESFMYIAPGLRYNLRNWLSIGTYLEFLMSGKTDQTTYSQVSGVRPPGGKPADTELSGGVPNYSSWRLGVSLGFNILPANFSSAPTEQRRKKLLDKLLEEEKGAQKASNQLDKLKNVRLRSEKELEQIRLELEGGQ